MSGFDMDMFERFSRRGARLPWLCEWLKDSVWSVERFKSLAAARFLEDGERMVNEVEEVIGAAAGRVYEELTGPTRERDVRSFLAGPEPSAMVVFDGMSLRERPALLGLASKAGMKVVEDGVGLAAVPSETVDFVERRLGFGRVGPSQLPARREVKERGIAAYYYDSAGQKQALDREARALLLWSAFPDSTYQDSGARFREHFEQIQAVLQSAWNSTVMAIPRGRRILITSDHGYLYAGAGLTFPRTNDELRPLSAYLGGGRSARISQSGEPPEHDDLIVDRARDMAALRGRVFPHPPGPSSGRLYKHGGLSLMEMLTPWLVLATS